MAVPLILSDVPNKTPYIQYVATNGQTVFPYPFPITQDSDLIVVPNGVPLNTGTGYTLSGQGNDTGGNVTFTLGRTVGDIITLYRDIAIQRISQIAQNSGFSSTVFNAEFNNIYLVMQQLKAAFAQFLQIPNTNNPAPVTTLTPAAYANKYLSFDANGNPTPAVLTSSGAITAAILAGVLNASTPQVLRSVISTAQTPAEAAAIVTPTSTQFLPGDFRRYGVNVGTGGDDTAAITTALSIVQQSFAAMGLTFLSTGNHSMVAGASLVGPGKIKLSGGSNTLINMNASNTLVKGVTFDCSLNSSASKVAISIGGTASNVEVSDNVLTQARVLTVGTNTNIWIRRNNCSGSCVGGISGATLNIAASGTCNTFEVKDNTINASDGSGIGIFNLAGRGKIAFNTSSNNVGSGITLQSGQYLVVHGNLCENNLQLGIVWQPPAATTFSQRSVISGNICKGNGFDGFDINLSNLTPPSYGYMEIIGNHAENNGTNINGGTGFYLVTASSCSLVGNTALGNNTHGILIQGGTYLAVTGNICTANGSGSPGTYNGITLNGASNCTVVGNISTNQSGGINQGYGIAETGSANGNVMSGNNCTNNLTGTTLSIGPLSIVRDDVGGYLDQSFLLGINNNAGVIQHTIYAQAGATVIGNFSSRINNATAAATNTPTGTDASTAMAGGAKIGSASTNNFWMDTAPQIAAQADLMTSVVYNDTATAVTCRAQITSININGVTQNRLVLQFYNGATAFALNTTNITAGKSIQIQFKGRLN